MKVRKWSTGLDEEPVGGDAEHGRVVPAVEADEHVGVRDRGEAPEHPVQDRARDLGAAAPAAHGGGGGELVHRGDRVKAARAADAPDTGAEPPHATAPRGGRAGAVPVPRRRRPRPLRRSLDPHCRKLLVLPHPAPVDPVLDPPHPAPFERETAPGRDRVPVPARDEGEGEGLRPIGSEGAPGRKAQEVLGKHRTLADRVDAGLRQRAGIERGDVAGREHGRIARRLQGLPDADEPRVVEVEPTLAEPVGGARVGDRDREVAVDRGRLSARRHRVDSVRAYRDHPVTGEEPHPALAEEAGHPAPDGRGVRLDDLACLREEGDLDPVRHPGPLEEGAKAVPEGERQLRSPGAAPDHRDSEPSAALKAVALDRRPPFAEDVDRLDPEGVLLRPLDVVQGRLRADVDGEEVETDGGTAGREDAPRAKVDPGRRGVQDPRVREPRELPEVDVRLRRRVVPGDEAGEHPRVGGEHVARDEGEAHPGDRAHSETLEHRHVAVAAPDQHDVGRDGRGRVGVHVRAPRHREIPESRDRLGPRREWRKRVGVEPTGHVSRVPSDLKSVRPTGRRSSSLSSGRPLVLAPGITRGARPLPAGGEHSAARPHPSSTLSDRGARRVRDGRPWRQRPLRRSNRGDGRATGAGASRRADEPGGPIRSCIEAGRQ